jgi:hypothetical protein
VQSGCGTKREPKLKATAISSTTTPTEARDKDGYNDCSFPRFLSERTFATTSFRSCCNVALNFLSDLACWGCASAIRSACTLAIIKPWRMSTNMESIGILLPFYAVVLFD